MSKRALALPSLLALSGCFSTHYSLLAPGDERRELVTDAPPPENWNLPSFDDGAWTRTSAASEPMSPAASGAMPALYIRQRFDLGPDPESYKQLTLSFNPPGDFKAYINGQSMGANVFPCAAGVMKSTDNLLAIEIHPAVGTKTVAFDTTLSGQTGAKPIGPQIVKGPYLLSPTTDGITIAWETDSPAASLAIVDGQAYDGGAQAQHFVKVTGLQSDMAYRYHVEAGGTHSEEADFTTAPAPGRRLRFAVFGDNRTDGDVHRRLVGLLEAEAPDFLLNTGDMVGESNAGEWQTFFDIEYPLLIKTPLFPAMGNHENDYDDRTLFNRYFPIGNQEVYQGRVYSVDYGDAHVALLDSNQPLESQAHWLDLDLTAAEQRGARASFVVMHWGPICACASVGHGSNDDAIESIEPVARAHRVAAILSGHNHLYERGVDNGVNYVVTGGGGAPLVATGWIAQTRATQSVNHYVMIDLLGDSVHLTAKDETGTVIDDAQWTP
ncbi:MAG TPA: metallophosphoesterase family protein [Polyangia bacterium]|nr:metallophosphoesterase family protein [Polyangia bacterium]